MIIKEKGFVHHVYFWLKNPRSTKDYDQLIEGLTGLSKAETIQSFHIGRPASTRRDVVESGYSVSWLVLFKDKGSHDSYQTDPIHLKFVDQCAQLWGKLIVYDSINI